MAGSGGLNVKGIGLGARVRRLAGDDRGATAVEYGLIAVFIAALIFGVVTILGHQVSSEFNSVVGKF